MHELAQAALDAAAAQFPAGDLASGTVGRSALLGALTGYGGALQDALDFTVPAASGYYPPGFRNPGLQNDQIAAYQHELDLLKNLGVGVKAPAGGFVDEGTLLDAIHDAINRLLHSIQTQTTRGTRQNPLHVVTSSASNGLLTALARAGLRG